MMIREQNEPHSALIAAHTTQHLICFCFAMHNIISILMHYTHIVCSAQLGALFILAHRLFDSRFANDIVYSLENESEHSHTQTHIRCREENAICNSNIKITMDRHGHIYIAAE